MGFEGCFHGHLGGMNQCLRPPGILYIYGFISLLIVPQIVCATCVADLWCYEVATQLQRFFHKTYGTSLCLVHIAPRTERLARSS